MTCSSKRSRKKSMGDLLSIPGTTLGAAVNTGTCSIVFYFTLILHNTHTLPIIMTRDVI